MEAAFSELMELANQAPADTTPDEPMEDVRKASKVEAPCKALPPDEDMAPAGSQAALGVGVPRGEWTPLPVESSARLREALTSDEEMAPAGTQAAIGAGIPRGAWTPFAVESSVRLGEVQPPSPLADVMQVRMVAADRFAGFVLGKSGSRIQEIALTAGCRVWMTSRQGDSDRHIVMIGNYRQCKAAQELVHEQLAKAQNADWQDTEVEVLLLVRAEAAGVVTGKQGFVLSQIREQSGASIQLLREEVEGQRPCILAGSLPSVLRAEKHVFDLVRAVPVTSSEPAVATTIVSFAEPSPPP